MVCLIPPHVLCPSCFADILVVVGTDPKFFAPFSDNNLINGKMDYDCSLVTDGRPCVSNAGLSKFKFRAGKTHRLRLINAGAAGLQHFSIDGHEMTVIANDFVPVVPYTTKIVTMGVRCFQPIDEEQYD